MLNNKTICVIFINWNDSFYIPFLARHYSYADQIVMYDNYSTDNSVEIAKAHGIQVRQFGFKGELSDQAYLIVKNLYWKRYREFDYVIMIDVDEFLVIDHLSGTLPKVQGYNMISEDLPKADILEINTGYEDKNYSKQAIFSTKLQGINYAHGAHTCNPIGPIDRSGSARLYHYRCIGGFDRLWDRHQVYQKRMSALNKRHGWGAHYLTDKENKEREWSEMTKMARELWWKFGKI